MSGNGSERGEAKVEAGRAGGVKPWRQTERSSTGVDGVKGDGRVAVPVSGGERCGVTCEGGGSERG